MLKRYRWYIVFMLFLAGVINYVDRSAFSVAAPLISKSFRINSAELGIIFSGFSIGYVFFNFIGGYLSDIYGPKKVFSGSMVIWSIFCGLTIVAFNMASLFIIRLIFGFSEGPLGSTTNKTLSNWVPAKQRARAVGVSFAGNPLGGAIAGPIVGLIAFYWNWRVSFIILAVIGLVWALIWNKTVTDQPHQNSRVSKEELEELEQGVENKQTDLTSKKLPLSFFIKKPTILFTAFSFFGFNYILFFFMTWFPSYLTMARGLNIKQMGIVTIIPWLIGSLGLVLSGLISDYLVKKTSNLLFSRKIILVIGLILSSICVAFAGTVSTAVSAVTLMTLGVFFMYMTATSYWSIISDTVGRQNVGGVTGFTHAIANISGIIAPIVTGFIVQGTGKFTSAFILAGAIGVIGALGVAFFVRQVGAKSNHSESISDSLAR